MTRIIAGRFSSRRILTPDGSQTRPTSDRTRESVFALLASMLGVADEAPEEQLAGLAFADLFAGSGAVGLEAASRGAWPTWVENNRGAAKVIERNQRELGAGGRLIVSEVGRFLEGRAQPYDIIWMDPPYDVPADQVDRLVALADQRGWLANGGVLLVERSVRSTGLEFPENFLNNDLRRYGDTAVYLGRKGRR